MRGQMSFRYEDDTAESVNAKINGETSFNNKFVHKTLWAKMAPKHLSEDRELARQQVCSKILQEVESDTIFNTVATSDETYTSAITIHRLTQPFLLFCDRCSHMFRS